MEQQKASHSYHENLINRKCEISCSCFFLYIFGTAKKIQVTNVPAKKTVCTNYIVVPINSAVSWYNIGSF